jgi:prepilin-type N-terminal cleavage/methylation domain-containing protein
MKTHKKSKNLGFTLIELLIVVLLLAVLSSVVIRVINSAGVQGKARDSQRKSDLKRVQTALELYFVDHRAYPGTGDAWVLANGTALTAALIPGYTTSLPKDPIDERNVANPCNDNAGYSYKSNGQIYMLTALMEVPTSADESLCSDLFHWPTIGCPSPSPSCYGVQNP